MMIIVSEEWLSEVCTLVEAIWGVDRQSRSHENSFAELFMQIFLNDNVR